MNNNRKIKVEIDKQSGFCFGVVNAISQAEEQLESGDELYCLGEIVHNSEEVKRLQSKGLTTINYGDLENLKGKRVLLRAHGEPPETYKKAAEKGVEIIDATCPVVLKLQSRVRDAWARVREHGGKIVVFGKKGHAEVVGLVGQTQGEAVVISSMDELDLIDFTKPIELFAQTTISPDDYKKVAEEIKTRMELANGENQFHLKSHNSICGQVANRKKQLKEFAKNFEVVIFVSGKASSNGKMLYEECKGVNPNTYFVSSADELDPKWFENIHSVGVCGATSTPLWLMEEVATRIENS